MCPHISKQTHFPMSLSGIPQHLGKAHCYPKKLMQNRSLPFFTPTLFFSIQSCKTFVNQIRFPSRLCNCCFCWRNMALRAFIACLSARYNLCCCLIIVSCCVTNGEHLFSEFSLDIKDFHMSLNYSLKMVDL